MKRIEIYSHKAQKTIRLPNLDEYDSIIKLYSEYDELLYECLCNVDSSNKISNNNKIEIINGDYFGIVGLHKQKYKAILMLNCNETELGMIKKWVDTNDKTRTFKTYEINKNWGDKIAKYINIHKGGYDWDWSEGCITIPAEFWNDFISFFYINEKIKIIKK